MQTQEVSECMEVTHSSMLSVTAASPLSNKDAVRADKKLIDR